VEEIGSPPQVQARLAPLPLAPQPFAVEQLGAGELVWRVARVGSDCRLELLARATLPVNSATAGEPG
jgi:hypothetical protein